MVQNYGCFTEVPMVVANVGLGLEDVKPIVCFFICFFACADRSFFNCSSRDMKKSSTRGLRQGSGVTMIVSSSPLSSLDIRSFLKKLQDRHSVFKKRTRYSEEIIEKWNKVFMCNLMSSENSGEDETIIIRLLPWCTPVLMTFSCPYMNTLFHFSIFSSLYPVLFLNTLCLSCSFFKKECGGGACV